MKYAGVALVFCGVWYGALAVEMTFALPKGAPDAVTWVAKPLPSTLHDNPVQAIWAPDETTPTIRADLPPGKWQVSAVGIAESSYQATITITPDFPEGLTIILPYDNIAGGDGVETDPSLHAETQAMITLLKTTFMSLQTQQASAHEVNETTNALNRFKNRANGKLGQVDFNDISHLLAMMGQLFKQPRADWLAAAPSLIAANDALDETILNEDIAMVCKQAPSCAFADESFNLSLQIPTGWALSAPYAYETAGGAKAEQATVVFIRLADDAMVSLNQRMASGNCETTRSGTLCYFSEDRISPDDLDIIRQGAN